MTDIEWAEARELIASLSTPFPDHAIEQRQGGGGKMLSYVATETVIRRLNAVCPSWSFEITSHFMSHMNHDILIVFGQMTIPPLGTRSGTGVQLIQDRSGEDIYKGAASDCLKKCATLFGVGLHLYGPDLEAGELPNPQQQSTTPPQRSSTQQQPRQLQQHPPQIRNPDAPATQPQMNAIRAMGAKKGMVIQMPDGSMAPNEQEIAQTIHADYQITWPQLTMGQASQIITDWQ
jgi:hypothetical protein